MAISADELYARWQQTPDAAHTIALCDALCDGGRDDLVHVVGDYASRQLWDNVPALIAAARMYTASRRLHDAQTLLVSAGKLAPREPIVYRWLGEVLLRKGDAERAEKVLERAAQLGMGRELAKLRDIARKLVAVQRTMGTQAAAAEAEASLAPGGLPPPSDPHSDGDVDTWIRDSGGVREALRHGRPAPRATHPVMPQQGPHGTAIPPAPLSHPHAMALPTSPLPQLQPQAQGFAARPHTAPNALTPGAPPARAVGARLELPALAPLSDSFPRAEPTDRDLALAPAPLAAATIPAPRPDLPPGAIPDARDVLDALALAGVYEPRELVAATWDAAARPPRRMKSLVTLVAMIALFVAGSGGAYRYVTVQRAARHVEAEALLAQVDATLESGDPAALKASEDAIARAFELESRSPHAALTWLRQRALLGLSTGTSDLAFEGAVARAKEVGVPEEQFAFAYVASFLLQGDTGGAATVLTKWDGPAQRDAYYALLAGATLERAGDRRARDRYSAALELAPQLVPARTLLARHLAMDGESDAARATLEPLRALPPPRLDATALAALTWARDPNRAAPPPDVDAMLSLPERESARLPATLRFVPGALRALRAVATGEHEQATLAIRSALPGVDSPRIAVWLGDLALDVGDEATARKAALTALGFSALDTEARVLAARVALLGGRIDEASKATEELTESTAEVALVRSTLAYEKLDLDGLVHGLEAAGADVAQGPRAAPMAWGRSLLTGQALDAKADTVLALARSDAPWSSLVAMDLALEQGDGKTATAIAAMWPKAPTATQAARLARLARLEGRLEDADSLSRQAMGAGAPSLRALIERVLTLVSGGKSAEATALLRQHVSVGGPTHKWLRAYALAASGKREEARAAVTTEDAPSPSAAQPLRVLALLAYIAMGDTRHAGPYAAASGLSTSRNADLRAERERSTKRP